MNHYLNYIIEANIGLCIVFVMYYLLFRKETDFTLQRKVLLVGILFALIVPLIHFDSQTKLVPALNDFVPTYWLPEITVGVISDESKAITAANSYWDVAIYAYAFGVAIFAILFFIQLLQVMRLIRKYKGEPIGKFLIARTHDDHPNFSFFNFIFIGNVNSITEKETAHIIRHEMVHSERLHSFDILTLNVIAIFFWFNPLLRSYKKIFVQLHEFEADARAVENDEVNEYCSLLARVALQSADFKIASHFNQSLTVKRINMMRTLKTKIHKWKFIALAIIAPVLFVAVACQDQVADDLDAIAKNSSAALIVPPHVQEAYDKLVKENPSSTYVMIQPNSEAMAKIKEFETKYGLPKSVHVFKEDPKENLIGKSESGVVFEGTKGPGDFLILEYNDQVRALNNNGSPDTEAVFAVVEEMPEYTGGMSSFKQFLSDNIKYPADAIQRGISATLFANFIVNKDGSISDVKVIQAKYASANGELKENELPSTIADKFTNEAIRVIQAMPKWRPGKQNGKNVRVRFVVPINFQ
ncbi:energy transducer TonB [Pseudochryseolinea flava]|uniref:TonB C-terminal domain-containing protein n=1 Tax=Pseudochryseolinea flava TaxID=2059302 RepID=A0A364XUL0_9BACT|nr:M56 family metallopeptidase [Pseudochryseolinea flava]RAV97948.1 hypothetical protein DQQ10_26110 [Pseudochryseolinea flava]